jgi:hypothetical protein
LSALAKGSIMSRLQLASVNERLLSEDEAKLERLRNFYRGVRPPADDWRNVLNQAADILDHLGWCRGVLERDEQYCAIGAIIAAYSQGDGRCDGADSVFLEDPKVQEIIGKVETCLTRKSHKEEGLMGWNDSVAKSRKQVSSLLRRAAVQK